ncbi:MAG: hypothetical protein WKF71_13820 [Pyrinomonadaceae bacterium]
MLKICKVAGAGVAIGERFTFNVTTTGAGGGTFTNQIVVAAGPAATGDVAQNGFCDFVSGPFSGTGTFGAGGFFNVGSTVTVTEVLQTGVIVSSITSPTTGVGGLTTTGNVGTLIGANGIIFGTGVDGAG